MEPYIDIESQENKPTSADGWGFLLFRLVFVVLIAATVMTVRLLNSDLYREIKSYYDDYISVNITADYYLSEEK